MAKTASDAASDVLWLIGSRNNLPGYFAQAIAPDGHSIKADLGVAHAVTRTSDSQVVVDASGDAGRPTIVRTYDAATASPSREIAGAFSWPAEPDLTALPGSTQYEIVVVGTYMLSTADGQMLTKSTPTGGTESFPSKTWQTFRHVEVFDIASGTVVSSAGPEQVESGTVSDAAVVGDRLLIAEHGPAHTRLLDGHPGSARLSASTVGGHARLMHADANGRAFLLTDQGQLAVWSGGSMRATADLGLNSLERYSARPFHSSVVTTSVGTVALVDASRRYIASIDTSSGKVIAQRSLATSNVFSKLAAKNGTGVAADASRRRIYIADTSGVSGGVWVHDANTLEVLDRWHSDVGFGLVWVGQPSGTVFMQTLEGPVAVHSADGSLVSFAPSPLVTTRAI